MNEGPGDRETGVAGKNRNLPANLKIMSVIPSRIHHYTLNAGNKKNVNLEQSIKKL
jgi:hypothetical protein